MMSSVLERSLKKHSAADAPAARDISRLLENALAQTRSLARGLHPVSPADGGLTSALKELAARSAAMFGIQCQWRCRKEVHVDHETTATHLYRIAQEAVSNAVKHGHATRVLIQLSANAKGRITLVVRDHGEGIRPPTAGHQGMGLRIMRYRADMIGAELRLENESTGGTRLTCILPAPIPPTKKTHAKKSRPKKSRTS
jgi:signal transduction histidine kinase